MKRKNESGSSNNKDEPKKKQIVESTSLILNGFPSVPKKVPLTLKRSDTEEEIQEDKPLKRTNSITRNAKGEEDAIRNSTRNNVGGHGHLKEPKDGLRVAVFSQEASRNFSRKYHQKVQTKGFYQPQKGIDTTTVDADSVEKLTKKLTYHSKVRSHEEAFVKLFENRESPHVVAVVEGKRDTLQEEITLKEGELFHTYKLDSTHIEGKTAKGSKDHKQNMHFYVREDMQEAIKPAQAMIGKGAKAFPVGEIQFETEKGKHSILVPHIPNAVAKNPIAAHQALQDYGEKVKSERTVVGYMGDTNFSRIMQPNSSPSVGGNLGAKFVSPTSSGAAKHTHFMQGVSFATGKDSFQMKQPKTLNHVNLQLGEKDKTATDHPSIQTTILLDSTLKGRGDPKEKTKKKSQEEENDSSTNFSM